VSSRWWTEEGEGAMNFTYFALIVLAIVVAFLLLRALGVMG
jgi:hypothetical protein